MTDVAASRPGEGGSTTTGRPSLLRNWRYVLTTTNPPEGHVDAVSRWLVISRAAVLPMTVVAGALAGLLAVFRGASVDWWYYALAAGGIVLAHVANNFMNDLFDLEVGTDSETYPRNLYSPHPVLSGMISRGGLLAAALAVNLAGLAIMLYLFTARGAPILWFALSGFVLSAAYTAPPLRLKKRGLGEPTVLVVWGPLMVGGTYYAATGTIPGAVLLASVPYALLAGTVLMGKHVDKIPWDAPAGTRTLPVVLGDRRALAVTRGMIVAFFVMVGALVAARVLPVGTVLVVGAWPVLRRVWRALGEPRPDAAPPGYPIWPLWYAAHAFLLTRRAGSLFVAGLVLGAIFGV